MAVGLLGVLRPLTASLLWKRFLPHSLPHVESLPASAVSDYLLSEDIRTDNVFSCAQLALSTFIPTQTTAANQMRHHFGITVTTVSTNQHLNIVNILISGDINPNPGPIRCPCGACSKPVKSNQRGMCCDGKGCNKCFHIQCTGTSIAEYKQLSECVTDWFCTPCTPPRFTDYFFDTSTTTSMGNLSTGSFFILDQAGIAMDQNISKS
jgi:hypothetical protein